MKKIGITIAHLDKIDKIINSNGISQNIIFFYNYMKKIENIDFYLISNKKNSNYKSINISDLETIKTLDFLICGGMVIEYPILKMCKEKNIRLIYWRFGNDLIYETNNMLHNNESSSSLLINYIYDEIWISPHFEYGIDYYKYVHKNENVIVAPYFWDPFYLDQKINNSFDKINIGVFESNLNFSKSCFIPIMICEKAKNLINKAYILSGKKMYDTNKNFREFLTLSDLFKNKNMTAEKRHKFLYVMKNYCNVVVSFVENCDLNYLFLECFYLGIPLVHNSKILKDYGYYYDGYNISQAVEHIKNIKNKFNKEEYIEKHKEILYKYSLKNETSQLFFKRKFNLINEN